MDLGVGEALHLRQRGRHPLRVCPGLQMTQGEIDFGDGGADFREHALHAAPAQVLGESLQDLLLVFHEQVPQRLQLVCVQSCRVVCGGACACAVVRVRWCVCVVNLVNTREAANRCTFAPVEGLGLALVEGAPERADDAADVWELVILCQRSQQIII